MTKKDYQAIARALYGIKLDAADTRDAGEMWQDAMFALANVLHEDNSRFDRARFVEACETGTTKGMK